MQSLECSRRARESIKPTIRQDLARYSGFACSICGSIPIVFHHIEEWSKSFSNAEEVLIPICDKCHRRIHGEGGTVFSKEELYQYKAAPRKPMILRDVLPFEKKRQYSFFIGSNFVADGEKARLFWFSDTHSLVSIDTSSGVLRLSILASIRDDEPLYLIRDNELVIHTVDVWDMRYSGSSLKIWRAVNGRKEILVDLIIKPDVIVLRGMNTSFNGRPFCIRRLRRPQQRQVDKIVERVKECEDLFQEKSAEIDSIPRVAGFYSDIDLDATIKQVQKDGLRMRLEQHLKYEFCNEFNWDWHYYQWVLDGILQDSGVFRRTERESVLPRALRDRVMSIREKYDDEFEELGNVTVEYDGNTLLRNLAM